MEIYDDKVIADYADISREIIIQSFLSDPLSWMFTDNRYSAIKHIGESKLRIQDSELDVPDKIYLQTLDNDGDPIEYISDATWCMDKINEADIEYVNAEMLQNWLGALEGSVQDMIDHPKVGDERRDEEGYPRELEYSKFTYKRMVDSYRDALRKLLSYILGFEKRADIYKKDAKVKPKPKTYEEALRRVGAGERFEDCETLKLSDNHGITIAHKQALSGWETDDPEILALVDKDGLTVDGYIKLWRSGVICSA